MYVYVFFPVCLSLITRIFFSTDLIVTNVSSNKTFHSFFFLTIVCHFFFKFLFFHIFLGFFLVYFFWCLSLIRSFFFFKIWSWQTYHHIRYFIYLFSLFLIQFYYQICITNLFYFDICLFVLKFWNTHTYIYIYIFSCIFYFEYCIQIWRDLVEYVYYFYILKNLNFGNDILYLNNSIRFRLRGSKQV